MKVAPARVDLIRTLDREELTRLQFGWPLILDEPAERTMLAEARRHDPLETCGFIWMRKAGGNYHIALAGIAGPHAEHERMTSYPNLRFSDRWCDRIRDKFGKRVWLIGQWHTHPFSDEPMPSAWDLWGGNQDRKDGFFFWNDDQFGGREHIEIIMSRRRTRAWWVTTNPDRIRLVAEWDIGFKR